MKFNLIHKSLAIAALCAAAAISSADSFSVIQAGSWSQTGPVLTANTILVPVIGTLQDSTIVPFIGSATLSITESAAPTAAGVSVTGTLKVNGATPASQATFSVSGTIYQGSTLSLSASGVLTGTTGVWSHYTSGVDNISYQFVSGPLGKVSVGTISANMQAVPEPSTFAVIGVGAIGLILRRRAA